MTQILEKIDTNIFSLEKVFVPTMGALHEGHIALIKDAKKFDIPILCSIFINPIQFNDKNDFKNYPKNLNKDIEMLNELGVDFIFTPKENYIYQENQFENISSGYTGTLFEGKSRPGHFDGVLTVVKRLFELVNPKVAIFGAKDAQQLFLIKEMIKKYSLPITIVESSTVREESGLALSSRNQLLTSRGKKEAQKIFQNLIFVSNLYSKNKDINLAIQQGIERYKTFNLKYDYLEVVDKNTFQYPDESTKELLFLTAVYVDNIRLIDNLSVKL
jgi:pantoate--beta-alanine ligase